MAGLQASIDKFEMSADRLGAAIAHHMEATKKRRALALGAITADRALREQLAPIVDDAGFELLTGLEALRDDHEHDTKPHALASVSARQAADLQALADLRAEDARIVR